MGFNLKNKNKIKNLLIGTITQLLEPHSYAWFKFVSDMFLTGYVQAEVPSRVIEPGVLF